jgi:hypothetical protein
MPSNCGCNECRGLYTVQSFDQTMTQGAREIIARADGGHWRFFIQSENNMIVVEVVQDSIIGSLKSKTIIVHPNSAQEIQGRGAVIVYGTAQFAIPNSIVRTANLEYIDRLEPTYYPDDVNQSLNGAWVNLGSNNGYPIAYTTHLRIYCNEQIRIRATNPITGDIPLDLGIQPSDEVVLRDLLTQTPLYWEVRQAVANPTIPAFIQAIWYRP